MDWRALSLRKNPSAFSETTALWLFRGSFDIANRRRRPSRFATRRFRRWFRLRFDVFRIGSQVGRAWRPRCYCRLFLASVGVVLCRWQTSTRPGVSKHRNRRISRLRGGKKIDGKATENDEFSEFSTCRTRAPRQTCALWKTMYVRLKCVRDSTNFTCYET